MYEVTSSRTVYDGAIISVRVDTVTMPDGMAKDREVVEHAEAAAIVAIDNRQRVLLIEQYRHAVGRTLTELPAGLRDDDDPDLLATARRELREEVGLTATDWSELVALRTSPGILTEFARVFLARGLTQGDRAPDASSEEENLEIRWVPLVEAVADVRAGRITDAMAVAGLLAADLQLGDRAAPPTKEIA
jgi:8-oxo-dGTP pyrophosphatase MutT (NUDIX family)